MCKHENCVILEEFHCNDKITIRNGQVQTVDMFDPVPIGKFFVRCHDCGLERVYGVRCPSPKWLQKYLNMALVLIGTDKTLYIKRGV